MAEQPVDGQKTEPTTVAEMGLRDYFAAHTDIPHKEAYKMVATVKLNALKKHIGYEGKDKNTLLKMIEQRSENADVTAQEIAEMRALLRYIEADAMMKIRKGFIPTFITDKDLEEVVENRWEALANE